MCATLLEARSLACLRGGRLVFTGLSFRLDAGEALVLTGSNGSGKSSLLRLVAGLVPVFAGTLDWTGAPGSIAYLGHQDAVKPILTPRETLRFWGAVAGAAPNAAAIDAALAAVGLARFELDPAQLWLLDEPTLGLDTTSVARLEARVAQHRARGGIVMLATHVPLALGCARGLALEDFAMAEAPL
jgi:heme exporter protein A